MPSVTAMSLAETPFNGFGMKRESMFAADPEDFSAPVMTRKEIAKAALEQGGYSTPRLNDKLYLHYKGYKRIENLDEYVELKALFLDSNGFSKIENVDHLSQLRCLFLQRNLLSNIENLGGLISLVQLDLSENRILKVEGLACLPNLSTLNLARNVLADAKSIDHLKECLELSVLDLSHNGIQGDDVVDTLSKVPKLVALNMVGNPVVSDFPHFRKKSIVAMKGLKYLDRPVFDMERATAEAWSSGGREAELAMKKELQKQKAEEDRKGLQDFRRWQAEMRAKKLEEQELLRKNGPTPEQIAESDRREEAKRERAAAAEREAEREREEYRLPIMAKEEDAIGEEEKGGLQIAASPIIGENSAMVVEPVDEMSSPTVVTPPRPDGVSSEEENHEAEQINFTNNGANEMDYREVGAASAPERLDRHGEDEVGTDIQTTGVADESNDLSGAGVEGKAVLLAEPIAAERASKESELYVTSVSSAPSTEEVADDVDHRDEESAARRKLLIEESLAIYRAENATSSTECLPHENEDFGAIKNISQLQWSETMDRSLVQHVKSNLYDFAAASLLMRDDFPNVAKLDAESCRLRWCLLDSRDTEDANEPKPLKASSAEENDRRYCARIIKNADGKQASLEEMQRRDGFSSFRPPTPPDASQWSDADTEARFLGRSELWKLQETNFEMLD